MAWDQTGNHPDRRRTRYHCASDPANLPFLFRSENKIEYRKANNLEDVGHYFVEPCQPYRICSVPGDRSALLFIDVSEEGYKTFKVHFDEEHQQLQHTKANAKLVQFVDLIYDMCYSTYKGKEFIVVTRGSDGMYCYNLKTGNIEWGVKGGSRPSPTSQPMILCGLTTDGRGRLFVCDSGNSCIQMFSIPDGKYLDALVRAGGEELGILHLVSLCKESSSLIVTHKLSEVWRVSVISLNPLYLESL